MLCIKQIFAVVLFIFLLIVSMVIIPSIYKSFKNNTDLQKPRKFHIPIWLRFGPPNMPTIDSPEHDIAIDLEIAHPFSILTVDEPVDASAVAIIKPELLAKIRTMLISLEGSQAYPIELDERGIIKMPKFRLNKSQHNIMIGTARMCWPLEGRYQPKFSIKFMDGSEVQIPHGTDFITVFPKSEIVQMVTNKVLMELSFAAYLIGVFGALNFIYLLWT